MATELVGTDLEKAIVNAENLAAKLNTMIESMQPMHEIYHSLVRAYNRIHHTACDLRAKMDSQPLTAFYWATPVEEDLN